jgi:hypothetical protein
MFTVTFFHSPHSKRFSGSGNRAGRSSRSKSSRRLAPYTRVFRSLSSTTSSAMRSLSSSSEKKVWLRRRPRIHRCAIRTPASTFALSRACAGRAGKITVP